MVRRNFIIGTLSVIVNCTWGQRRLMLNSNVASSPFMPGLRELHTNPGESIEVSIGIQSAHQSQSTLH